ncbi:putative methyltransferase-domain-containing protein [Phycomyces nitens]|nr:putative methyltransferase-domain-containing protein [Phycomyces nitens]
MASSIKRITYKHNGKDAMTVFIQEALDPTYGCYLWPSAIVMGDYVWNQRHRFANRTVLEVGAGTSLPSLVLAKLASGPRLIISDLPKLLPVIQGCLALNKIEPSDDRLWVCPLIWGEVGLNGIDWLTEQVNCSWDTIDYILGSDTFYDPADFEKLLMLVAHVIHRHNNKCVFITAYQERSAKRSIQYLLDKWSLQCRLIPKESFESKETRDRVNVHSGTFSVFMLEIKIK